MKSPGSGGGGKSSGGKGGKAKGGKSGSGGKFPSKKALRREYKGEARREEASSRREMADAAHRRAEAAHYEQEAAKAEREGYKKEAEYDLAKARREQAEARRDTARARRNQAKSTRNQVKSTRVGLAQGSTLGPETWISARKVQDNLHPWILGGNDWHRGCAAVALANSLLMATGLRVTDQDVLDLYSLTAGDPGDGAGVLATLEVAAEFGLGGLRPVWFGEMQGPPAVLSLPDLPSAALRLGQGAASTLLLDLRLQQAQRRQPVWDRQRSPDWGAHAGVLAGDTVVTWGREVPVTGDFLATQVAGAWQVEWPAIPCATTRRPAPMAACSR